MNSDLNNFFREERKRVVEPGPFFVQRVMTRLGQVRGQSLSEMSIWDIVPAATRPVFAIALTILFAVLAIQILVPIEPSRGAIDAYVSSGLTPSETLLFTGAETPTNAAYIEEFILEPGQ
jgi:hypothetical protein